MLGLGEFTNGYFNALSAVVILLPLCALLMIGRYFCIHSLSTLIATKNAATLDAALGEPCDNYTYLSQ